MNTRSLFIISLAVALAFSLPPMIFDDYDHIPSFIVWIWILMYPLSMFLCFYTYSALLRGYANKRREQLRASNTGSGCTVMEMFEQHQQRMSRAAVGMYATPASSPPPLPTPTASTSAQAMEAIKTLHNLKSEGLISDTEFDAKKQEILSRL